MIQNIHTLIEKLGLDTMKETILAHLHECMYLYPQKEDTPTLATSRLGGYPDFPPGWTYPEYQGEPLSFIGQLNLEDVQRIGVANELPERGLLYFFYDAAEQSVYGGELPNRDGWRVLYYDGDLSHLQTLPYPGTHKYGVLPANNLQMIKGLSLHSEAITVPDEHWDVYWDQFLPAFAEINGSPTWHHQALGHPHNIQNDVFDEIDYFRKLEGNDRYTLLLQVDTDEENLNIMWGDVGTIYFVIAQDDLRERNFANCYFSYQCC
ncbi:YwqG family protein [Brevibacillus sp. AY1]|uniref:YwqG family protein n=1 Tax=Brevibacillus sp. AY1 TaxID=2807621 RepID=UPI0024538C99|nr:YwqG family protein [Brevibacillus sp. AY1]MDH4619197.1 DUF1963 domain-containing protein [Brevibacillus sp. AY1]